MLKSETNLFVLIRNGLLDIILGEKKKDPGYYVKFLFMCINTHFVYT